VRLLHEKNSYDNGITEINNENNVQINIEKIIDT